MSDRYRKNIEKVSDIVDGNHDLIVFEGSD